MLELEIPSLFFCFFPELAALSPLQAIGERMKMSKKSFPFYGETLQYFRK